MTTTQNDLLEFAKLSQRSRLEILTDPGAILEERTLFDVTYHGLPVHAAGFETGPTSDGFTLAGNLPSTLGDHKARLDAWWNDLPEDIRAELQREHAVHLPAKFYGYFKRLGFVDIYRLEPSDGVEDWSDRDFRLSPPLVHDYLALRAVSEL